MLQSFFGFLRSFYCYLIYGNILIAAAAYALTAATLSSFTYQQLFHPAALMVFFATLSVYSADRIQWTLFPSDARGSRLTWVATHQTLLWIHFVIGIMGVLLLLPMLAPLTLPALAAAAIVTLFRIIPFGRIGPSFFQSGTTKTALVALVWGGVTVILPASELGISLRRGTVWFLFLERTFFVLALSLPFEVRDAKVDQLHKRSTLVHQLGHRRTVALAALFALAASFLAVVLPPSQPTVSFSYAISGLVILYGWKEVLPDFYYSFLLDGLLFLPAMAMLI